MKVYVAVFPVELLTKVLGIAHRLMNKRYKIAFSEYKIYVPLREVSYEIIRIVEKLGGEIVDMDDKMLPRKVIPRPLKELERIHDIRLPQSLNILGDILTINEIPDGSIGNMELIGELLRINFGVRAVFVKSEKVSGVTRTARWKRISGWGDTFTVHRENGCFFAVDIEKVFFNPRLNNERIRIVNLARLNENVIDMFAGVGPFSIQLAKFRHATVLAIDINPWATKLMALNAMLNKVENRLIIRTGDARRVLEGIEFLGNRIIMNYPERSIEFLDIATKRLEGEGWIHIYKFGINPNEEAQTITKLISSLGLEIKELKIRKVSEVAPRRYIFVFDLLLRHI